MVFFVVVRCYTTAYFGFSPQVTYLLQLILVLFGLLAALAVSTGWFWSRELNLDLAGGVGGGFKHLIRVGAFCFTGHVSGSRLQNKHRQGNLELPTRLTDVNPSYFLQWSEDSGHLVVREDKVRTFVQNCNREQLIAGSEIQHFTDYQTLGCLLSDCQSNNTHTHSY